MEENNNKMENNVNAESKEQTVSEKANNNVPTTDRKGFAIASLVLGIISIPFVCWGCIGLICGILGLVFGILGLKSTKRGLAIAGIVTGTIGLFICLIMIVVGAIIGSSVSLLS